MLAALTRKQFPDMITHDYKPKAEKSLKKVIMIVAFRVICGYI